MTPTQGFFARSEEMFKLYGEGKFTEALAFTERLAADFPEQAANTDLWRICLLSVSGSTTEALTAMQKSLAAGMWWSEAQLRGDRDLAALQGDPEFERMLALCRERHAAAQAVAKAGLLVREPEGKGPHPLLIALHGRGSRPDQDLDHWEPVVVQGWLLALPQSSQLSSPDRYVWDDSQKAVAEITGHFGSLVKRHDVDADHVILGGFSQGAALAIQMALRGDLPARGFLSVAPGRLAAEHLEALAEAAAKRGLRGYLVAGGHDPRYEVFKGIHDVLLKHGMPCMLEDHPDIGHEFPPLFERSLKKALKFLSSKEQE
jgi:predicted esterase